MFETMPKIKARVWKSDRLAQQLLHMQHRNNLRLLIAREQDLAKRMGYIGELNMEEELDREDMRRFVRGFEAKGRLPNGNAPIEDPAAVVRRSDDGF